MILLTIVALAAVIALLTWIVGWWAVLVVALVAGASWRRSAAIALASALGWATLLAFNARGGRMGALAAVLGGVFPVPGWGLMLVTLLFAALGAWSASTIGSEVARRVLSSPSGPSEKGDSDSTE